MKPINPYIQPPYQTKSIFPPTPIVDIRDFQNIIPHSARNAVNFLTPPTQANIFYTTLLDPKSFQTPPSTEASCLAEQKNLPIKKLTADFYFFEKVQFKTQT